MHEKGFSIPSPGEDDGGGKQALMRPAFVSKDAFVGKADWLVTGWWLWSSTALGARDFFLATPAWGDGMTIR